jgi:hypothetical protein
VLFAVDVAGFTDIRRDDEVQLTVREALYALLIEAFDGAHLPWEECLHEDRGDGVLIIIPAKMPSSTVVDPLVDRVRTGLRRHNRMASDAATIRLRVAVHIGEVHSDAYGLVGTAVNHLFRLLDAPALRQALVSSAADVALIVSDYFFDSVIRHSPGTIDPATYRQVTVEVKQTRTHGWIHVPGVPGGADATAIADRSALDAAERQQGAAAPRDLYGMTVRRSQAPAAGFAFYGPVTFYGDAVAGDKIVSADTRRRPIEDPSE